MIRSFPEIESYLSEYAGLNPGAMPGIIGRAVERILVEKQLEDPSEYLQIMRCSPKEFDSLLEQVLVPETWFFRYPEAYRYLQRHVASRLDPNPYKFRILSVPCSTGEEPYSIAISLTEAGLRPTQFLIDAADISHTALQKARKGEYTGNSFRGTDLTYRNSYFDARSDHFQLQPRILELVKFFSWNVLQPAPPQLKSNYDVIFCRNLFIYLHRQAQRKMIATLKQLLKADGLLFTGHAEAGPFLSPAFRPLIPMKAFVHCKT